MTLIGIRPKTGIVHLMNLRKKPNRLMSDENWEMSLLGKQFVQKRSSPLPNETCSSTSSGGWPCCLKKLNVCLKI